MSVDLSRVHLVGIGGVGMSGVAHILLDRGAIVSGSDVKDSRAVRVLEQAGAHVAIGHAAENLSASGSLPTVVVTSFAAIPQDNPELVAARGAGIPIIRRSDLLAELMEGYTQVLIAGTHGKTSTTSMAVVAMQSAALDPSFAIGGLLNKAGTNAHHGTGEVFVAEADESDASLLRYSPNVAVVTNVEPDHLDFFHTAEAYYQVFDDFAERITPQGTLVVCVNDEHAAAVGQRAVAKGIQVRSYGTTDAVAAYPDIPVGMELTAITHEDTFTRVQARLHIPEGIREGEFKVSIPGTHMALNATGAFVASVLAGGEPSAVAEGLSQFTGVRRRFEYHGEAEGIRVYDDYAHHPTEIQAVLTAAREAVGSGRVIACFQPHLYSRTMNFATEFAQALSLADHVVLLDIFGAREQPVEGVDSRIIAEKMSAPVIFEPDFSAAAATIASLAQPGDLVLTIGAGTVTMLAPEILRELSAEKPQSND